MSKPINVAEYRDAARAKLSEMAWSYYASGALDETTLRDNRAAFERVKIAWKVLRGVAHRSTVTTVLGCEVAMPILVAPTAFHGLAHPEGEVATVRAAGQAGTVMCLSTLSNRSIEEVCAAATSPVWFQLYVYRDRGLSRSLVQRAEAAGCRALVLTVDGPVMGTREADVRNGFHLPPGLTLGNVAGTDKENLDAQESVSGLTAYVASQLDPGLTWKDVDWLCSLTRLPVVLKGILRADDARTALDHGAAAVVVSNHGGRQLDGAVATLDALPAVVDAVGSRCEVFVDGGVRRGTDVLKALALGARAVLVGRPVLWGLAAAGIDGAAHVLAILQQELDQAMALSGCPTIDKIDRELVWR
jgi:4-hydroxymandelate oxidase